MGGGMGGMAGEMGATAVQGRRTLVPPFESFKNRDYRFYWAASMGQMSSMNMQLVARAWFMFNLTNSGWALGAMALAQAVPMLLLSAFGGVIADRVHKKDVLLAGQIASAAIALGVAVSISLGSVTWIHLIVAGILQGTVMALMMPSRQAMIPELVGVEGITNAVALNAAGMNLNRLLAPAASGFLIAGIGVEGVYYAMTGLYIMAILFVLPLPRGGTTTLRGRGALGDIKDGLIYVRHDPTILLMLLLMLFTVLLSMPYIFLLPMFTEQIFEVGAEGMGVLFSVSGLGAIAGSLFIASLGNRKRGLILLLSGLLSGVALAAFSFTPFYVLAMVLMIPVGLGQAGRMALSNTLIQVYVRDEFRGRVMSLYMMEFGLTSFGLFFVAVLADAIGVQLAVGGAAILLVFFTLAFIAFVPRIRKLD